MEAAGRTNLERIREHGQALQRDPDTLAFANLADAFRDEGMLREAEEVCRRGLERHPDYVTAHIVMGQICEDLQELDRAAAAYGTALRLDPANLVARTGLGKTRLRQGELEEAKAQFEHVLFANPAHEEARELLEVAEGRRPLPDWGREEESEPAPAAVASAPPAPEPEATTVGSLEAAVNTLIAAEGVAGVMVLGEDGLVVASKLDLATDEDAFGALIAEIHGATRRYVARMDMGHLERAVIDGAGGKLILAAAGARILAVTASNDAKLGMVNMQIDRAVAMMGSS